jgi:XTP/dITP diphosphohydrolase
MSSTWSDLLIGTGNPGKLTEIKLALHGLPLNLKSIQLFEELSVPVECGKTYAENAIIKATDYARQTGLCVLADDSGLEVNWLNGAPGLHSARFGAGSDTDRVELLLSKLSGVTTGDRQARFVSVVAIVHPTMGVINVAEGECCGRIAEAPSGNNGFGYDPIFVPEGFTETFGQLPSDVKGRISHRARALALTRAALMELLSLA